MKVVLQEYNEDASFFHSTIENRENDKRLLPSRAYTKKYKEFYSSYINEVLIGITKNNLPQNPEGYDIFNKTIELNLKKKSVSGKINIINFFGDNSTKIEDLFSFEDINLLTDFEQRYNDHLVSLPFTLRFRENTYSSSQILEDIKKSYQDYISTLKISNLLGYVPAYISHRELEEFIKFYIEQNNTTIKSPDGYLNFVPLLIDCKNSLPENYKRSFSRLRQMKISYLKDGYYLFYYAFSSGTPRLNAKRTETLAKDFLLSFLGFDIIGSSFARFSFGRGKLSDYINVSRFDTSDYNYHRDIVKKNEYNRVKPRNLKIQSDYLSSISKEMKNSHEYALNELKTRKHAYEYIETYK